MKARKRAELNGLLQQALEAAHIHGRVSQKLHDAQEMEEEAAKEAHEAIAAVYSFLAPPKKREVH